MGPSQTHRLLVVDNTSRCKVSNNCGKLIRFLAERRVEHVIVSNLQQLLAIDPKSICAAIFTGSERMLSTPINIDDVSHCMYVLTDYNVPVLGLCFGAQLLHILHGGHLQRVPTTICAKLPMRVDLNDPLFKQVVSAPYKTIQVRFCFNDMLVKPNKETMTPIAWTSRDIACGYRYTNVSQKQRVIIGLLCHPEYYKTTQYILDNFIRRYAMRRR